MQALTAIYVRHARALRVAWLGLLLLIAGCNDGDNGGGGGGDGPY